jgi:hypothetical protein
MHLVDQAAQVTVEVGDRIGRSAQDGVADAADLTPVWLLGDSGGGARVSVGRPLCPLL